MKPFFYIIKYGSVAEMPGSALGKCLDLHSTVGLIVYERTGGQAGMVLDTGRGSDWPEIETNLKKAELKPADISHVLLTHQHLDHLENLGWFPQAVAVNFGSASYLNRPDYGAGKLYKAGEIEIPEVRYIKVPNAHTRKDSVYVVDSHNEGKVAFLGDLIFATQKYLPQKLDISLDRSASMDPVGRYAFVKNLLKDFPDVVKFYAGHNPEAIDRKALGEYLEGLAAPDYQMYLQEWRQGRIAEMNKE